MSADQIDKIKGIFDKLFPGCKLYLFGSRTDASRRGGDIDLLILSEKKYDFKSLSGFRTELIKSLGDRKFDILNYSLNDSDPFFSIIMETAMEL